MTALSSQISLNAEGCTTAHFVLCIICLKVKLLELLQKFSQPTLSARLQ